MTANDFLTRGYRLKSKINNLYEALEYWHAKATRTGLIYSETGKQKTNQVKTNEKFIFKIIEIEDAIKKEIEQLYSIKMEIQEVLLEIKNPLEQSILFKRYIEELSWNEIAKKENFSKRNLFIRHNNGIQSVEKILRRRQRICHIEKQ